jgi:hypothetical protein
MINGFFCLLRHVRLYIFTYEYHLIFGQQTSQRLLLVRIEEFKHSYSFYYSFLLINMKKNLVSWIYIYIARSWSRISWLTSHSNQANDNRFLSTSLVETTIFPWWTSASIQAYVKLIMYVTFNPSLSKCFTCPKDDEDVTQKRN